MTSIALFVLVSGTATAATEENLAVFGQRIGPYRLQMTLTDLERMLGAGTFEETNNPRLSNAFWRPGPAPREVIVSFWKSTNKIAAIQVNGHQEYQTDSGLRFGSAVSHATRILGEPTIAEQYTGTDYVIAIFDRLGFGYLRDTRFVLGLIVFLPGTAGSLWRR